MPDLCLVHCVCVFRPDRALYALRWVVIMELCTLHLICTAQPPLSTPDGAVANLELDYWSRTVSNRFAAHKGKARGAGVHFLFLKDSGWRPFHMKLNPASATLL